MNVCYLVFVSVIQNVILFICLDGEGETSFF